MPSSDDESEPPASASDSDDERPSPFIAIPSKLNHEDDDTVPYILSLPNEIRSAILIHLSILDPTCLSSLEPIILDRIDRYPRLRPDDPRVSRLGWMNATHVCRRLRSVALATPELWASIVIVEDSTRWLSEILRRSGSQALSLLFHPLLVSLEHAPWIGRRFLESPADTDDACAILCQLDVLSRVEYIKIKDLYEWLPVAQTLLAHPAPRLKKLSLTPHEPSTKSKMVVLPQMLFASSAPHLRSLSLTQCDFSWSSLACFSTLTKLKLTRPEMAPRAEYEVAYALPPDELETASLPTHRTNALDDTPMKEILASLRTLPLLEELQLMHVLPIKQALNEQGLPRLELRHLRTLCIFNSRMRPIFYILDLLDAPQLRHFELGSCTIARPSDAHLQQRYAPLSRFLSRFTTNLPLPITYLRLDLKVSQVCVRAHFVDLEDPHDHIPDDHGEFCLAISLTILGTPNSPENFPIRCTCIEPIVSAISLSNLDTLEISDKAVPAEDKSYYTVDFVFWRRIYDLCSNAREVVARSLALVPLLPLLACRNLPHWRFTKPPAGTEPTVPVFPRLEHLDMSVGNLDQTDRGTRVSLTKGHPRLKHTDPTTVYLEVMRECLASRMESELPKLDYVRVSLVLWPREAREGVNKFEEEFRGVVQEGSGSCRLDIYTLEENRWTTERRHLWAPY